MEIIVVHGFLGSGKTTLCQKILTYLSSYKVAVLVNEFGEMAMDDQLLMRTNVTMKEIHNGSIFCSCKSDKFVEVMLELLKKQFDYILIETSGFANPDSLDRILAFIHEKSKQSFDLVHSITISDPHVLLRLWKSMPILQKQIEVADVIIVNKMDLCKKEELSFMNAHIREIRSDAQVLYCEYANVDIEMLLKSTSKHKTSLLKNHRNIDFSTITIRLPKKIEMTSLDETLQYLLSMVYRIKGFVETQEGMFLVQMASGQLVYEKSTQANQNLVVLYSSKQIGKKTIVERFKQMGGVEVKCEK